MPAPDRLPAAERRILRSIAEVDAAQWDALAAGNPFLRHAFLHALEATGCTTAETGWTPLHLTLWRAGDLVAAMPLYLKAHSYGEYVFDWAWADAYQRHGLAYYPKLLCAVPFSPVTGPRLLAARLEDRSALVRSAVGLVAELDVSSFHCLLPVADQAEEMRAEGMMLRSQVQFHWHNRDYRDFDHFLAGMNHDKRKKIKQERRRIREAGIVFRHLVGDAIGEDDWRFFARCYRHTYRAHGSTPYLNLDFFRSLGRSMPSNVLLIIAMQDGEPVASALNILADGIMYGRYWGGIRYVPGLHFETCYYQSLDFAIATGIRLFEGGAQGEHKLSRGFEPERTWSAHHLANPAFASAVEDFLQREGRGIADYIDELEASSPFKRGEA